MPVARNPRGGRDFDLRAGAILSKAHVAADALFGNKEVDRAVDHAPATVTLGQPVPFEPHSSRTLAFRDALMGKGFLFLVESSYEGATRQARSR